LGAWRFFVVGGLNDLDDNGLLMVYYCQKLRWFINGSLMVDGDKHGL
jgi:hypothetical protein